MFDDKELALGISGVTVEDAWVTLQLLNKAASAGIINPTEYEIVSKMRSSMVDAVERASGKNYDQMVLQLQQAQLAAQQAASQQEGKQPNEPAPEETEAAAE